jgi:hypothetical protein
MRPVTGCGVVAGCGATVAWGPDRVAALAAPVAIGVAITGLVLVLGGTAADREHRGVGVPAVGPRPERQHEVCWWCRVAAASVSVVMSLAVAAAVSTWCAVVVAAVLVTTAPPLRDRLRVQARSGRRGGPSVAVRGSPVPGSSPGAMRGDGLLRGSRTADLDTAELCRLWRVTFWMVRDLRAPARTLHVVELRHEVLDELERRHPGEVRRWLDSGRHGADGPSRYL